MSTHRETMSPAEIMGAAQLVVAVYGLQLQIMMTPASTRFFERTTDRRLEFGMLKIRSTTKTTRRQ